MAFIRSIEVLIEPKNGDAFSILELRIAFSIERTNSPEPNSAIIRIWNLTKDTSSKVTGADNRIRLRAGYKDEIVGTLFFGMIVKGRRYRSGNDYITELLAQDGRAAAVSEQVSVSFSKDIDALTVAQTMLDAIGLPFKGQENIPGDAVYPFGFCYIGAPAEGLRKVLNRFGLHYTVQNEMIYLLKAGEAAEDTGLQLTAENGLFTVPQPVSDKTEADDPQKDAPNRWGFSAMLFPELVPGAVCAVETPTFTGGLIIRKARYEGDNWEGAFSMDIEAEAV